MPFFDPGEHPKIIDFGPPGPKMDPRGPIWGSRTLRDPSGTLQEAKSGLLGSRLTPGNGPQGHLGVIRTDPGLGPGGSWATHESTYGQFIV
jgi:hypothetical protein